MEKQTKNPITREFVEKELRFNNTATIRYALVICAVTLPLFVPIAIVSVGAIGSYVVQPILRLFLSVVLGAFISAGAWIPLTVLLVSLLEYRRLKKGAFSVVECTLNHKRERMVQRHVEEVLGFDGFKEISVGHTQFQLATPGDVFYVVHYHGKRSIELCYSSKMYEYRE